jgi:HlyD family secretion protein
MGYPWNDLHNFFIILVAVRRAVYSDDEEHMKAEAKRVAFLCRRLHLVTIESDSPVPQRASAGPKRIYRPKAWRITAAAISLIAVAGFSWRMVWGGAATIPNAPDAAPGLGEGVSARRVEVVRPSRGGVRRLTIQPGTIHAFESVDLCAKVSGFLQSQKVDIGSAVTRGEVLAEIDAPELIKDLDEAEAQIEQARAQVTQAEARVTTAEAEQAAAAAAVAQARAEVERRVADRALSEKQFERVRELHARNAVDRKLVDEQEHARDSARAAERATRATVELMRAQSATANAKVQQAKADAAEARAAVRVAEAHRAHARVLVDYTRIVAPLDGVVTQRNFHPGAFIRSASEGDSRPLLTVRRTDLMRVVVQIPDLDVPLLDAGDRATVVIDALKAHEFAGTVARLGKAEDPSSRTMLAEIDLANPSGQLVEGMYGRATIELQPPTRSLTVPAACVVGHTGSSGAAIYVVRNGKARRISVTLGGDDGRSVEVLTGLQAGDQVIVRPGNGLDDGASVAATLLPAVDNTRH